MKRFQKGLVVGTACLLVVGTFSGMLAYFYSKGSATKAPLIYSEQDMLRELYGAYKKRFVEQGSGRTLDPQRGDITTSEGQSYTLMRAVWMDDQDTFDKSWQWTKDNLQREDYLFSWKFGKLADGSYGVLESEGGQNTATDGDTDIAMALLMAYSRWKNDDYYYDAVPLIQAVWDQEVVEIRGEPVLVASNLDKDNPEQVIINPSYFSPYAYKLFARVDKDHAWDKVADSSYRILQEVSDHHLGGASSAGLPPDWAVIDRGTGQVRASDDRNLATAFGFDAIRTPWRLALDHQWTEDKRSKELLAGYAHLSKVWQSEQRLQAIYGHDGKAAADYESLAAYGATIGYFMVHDRDAARQIYETKLSPVYDPDSQSPRQQLSYYDDNWVWFGLALFTGQLHDLAKGV